MLPGLKPHDAILRRLAMALLFAALFAPFTARAQTAEPYDPHTSLLFLGQDFANKIGADLKRANLYLSGAGKLELAELKAQTLLPDNEPLLIHLNFTRDRIGGAQDVYSLKQGSRLYMSLGDFFLSTGVAITVNAATGTAQGWFVRQSQTFQLDAKARTLAIQGKITAIDPADILIQDNDILVSSSELEKWFGMIFEYDFANLTINVASSRPFPVEEAYARTKKQRSNSFGDTPASLPYQEDVYDLYSLPFVDTNINGRIIHTPGNAPIQVANWSTIFSGDVAGFGAQGFLSGHEREPYLDTARLTLTRQDYAGRLLGPLHAKKYQIGDVTGVSNPLIGGSAVERGIVVSSRLNENITTDTSALIRGDAPPGWDVELYRNEIFIDIRHVQADGIYDFGNVDLAAGDNDFKFLLYGPQGETREEHRHIGVTAGALAKNTGDYAFSISQNSLSTWQREKPIGPDVGTPRISGRYQYGIPYLGTASVGAARVSTEGVTRDFLSAGLASYFLDTFINADVGYDAYHSADAEVLTLRRNFYGQSALLQYSKNAIGFNTSSLTAGASVMDSYRANIGGPLLRTFLPGARLNYSLGAGETNLYGGTRQRDASASLSGGIKSILLTTSVNMTESTSPGDEASNFTETKSQAITGNTTANGFIYNGSWRASADYQIYPRNTLTQAAVDYSRGIGDSVDGTAGLSYQPDPKLVTASLGLSWRASRATISPTARIDSQHNASVGVNVHFSAGADPYSGTYDIYNKYLTDAAGLAALVYRDVNGSGEWDDGDIVMPDVIVKALQERRNATSDAKGIAFIPDLQKDTLTDIIVDTATLPDSYDTTLFEGVSIRPHPGGVTKVNFPIVTAGEMDGQANFADKDGVVQSARNLKIALLAPDGKVEKSTVAASDGYWSISGIRPGVYYLTAGGDTEAKGYMVPRLVTFRQDGTTYFGQPVSMASGHAVNYVFSSENAVPDGPRHTRVIRETDIEGQRTLLRIGNYHSRLGMTIGWYKLKRHAPQFRNAFDLAAPLSQAKADEQTGETAFMLKPRKAMTLADAASACQELSAMKFNCGVEVITRYNGTAAIPAAPPATIEPAPAQIPQDAPLVASIPPSLPLPDNQPVIVVRPKNASAATSALVAEIADYAAANPILNAETLRGQTVILNLGSYNSRELMGLMWYKIKTRYTSIIADARLMVMPSKTVPSQAGKYTLRVTLPSYDLEDADARCKQLSDKGQYCSVEALPEGLQSAAAQPSAPKG